MELTPEETNECISFANKQRPQWLSFTGGEPLACYSDKIRYILDRLEYKPRLKVVTNGSVASRKNFESLLNCFGFDEVQVSIDKFHSKFCRIEDLIAFVQYWKKRNTLVSIAVSLTSPRDVEAIKFLPEELRALCKFNKVVRMGRARKTQTYYEPALFSKADLKGKCLMIEESTIVYVPAKGFSACCGNLIFGNSVMAENVAFSSIGLLVQSDFYKTIQATSFLEMLVDKKFENDPSNSISCNLCEAFFCRRYQLDQN